MILLRGIRLGAQLGDERLPCIGIHLGEPGHDCDLTVKCYNDTFFEGERVKAAGKCMEAPVGRPCTRASRPCHEFGRAPNARGWRATRSPNRGDMFRVLSFALLFCALVSCEPSGPNSESGEAGVYRDEVRFGLKFEERM